MTITLGNGPPGIKACAGTVLNMDCHAEQLLGFPLGLVFLPVFLRSSRLGSTGCETLLLPECGGEVRCRGLQWVVPCNSQPHRAIGKHHKLYWKLLVWLNYNYSSERNTVLRHSFLSRGGLVRSHWQREEQRSRTAVTKKRHLTGADEYCFD